MMQSYYDKVSWGRLGSGGLDLEFQVRFWHISCSLDFRTTSTTFLNFQTALMPYGYGTYPAGYQQGYGNPAAYYQQGYGSPYGSQYAGYGGGQQQPPQMPYGYGQ